MEAEERAQARRKKELEDSTSDVEKRRRLSAIEVWVQEIRVCVAEQMEADDEEWAAWDDVKGGALRVSDVKAARREEVEYMVKRRIWTQRPVNECWQRTGSAPISVRWVDTNKGVEGQMEVRSRLVARNFKVKGGCKEREDMIFASTPPLEALRMLCSKAAAPSARGSRRKMLFMDARKAHLNPRCLEDVYIELPEEVGAAQECVANWNFGCMV